MATQTAIVLDPVYSGKAALAMVRELQNNAAAFKGRRVLFLHTGTRCFRVTQPNTVGNLVYAVDVVALPSHSVGHLVYAIAVVFHSQTLCGSPGICNSCCVPWPNTLWVTSVSYTHLTLPTTTYV